MTTYYRFLVYDGYEGSEIPEKYETTQLANLFSIEQGPVTDALEVGNQVLLEITDGETTVTVELAS
jgi:hypothetical protein